MSNLLTFLRNGGKNCFQCKTIFKNSFTTAMETQCRPTFDTSCDSTLDTAYKQDCRTVRDVECRY